MEQLPGAAVSGERGRARSWYSPRVDVFQKMPDSLGEGRYTVGPLIRHGPLSRVHKGVQTATGDTVALKILEGGFADQELRKRFVAEIRALSEIQHPRIVRILAAGRDGALTWFALEFCEGGSLRERLTADGPAPPRVAARWVIEMLDGLQAVHDNQLIHRDVKPSNLLLDGRGRVKLTDFGVAHHPEGKVAFRTMQGSRMGSEQYTAPECRADASAATTASDVFSAGVTLFELLTADPPMRLASGRNREEVLGPVPRQFRAVVAKAAAMEPAERHASAFEMREDLVAAANDWSKAHNAPQDARTWCAAGNDDSGFFAWFRKKLQAD